MNLWNLKKANKFSKIELKIQLITDISMQKKVCRMADFNRIERLIHDTFD